MMSDFDMSGTESDDIRGDSRSLIRTIASILVEQGHLRRADADAAQRYAGEHGLDFVAAAIELKLVRKEDIEVAMALQFDFPTLALGVKGGVAEDVVLGHSPTAPLTESVRALRSQLTFRWMRTSQRKALAVVSPDRGEGRSWLAANLATAFAQIGKRVLLIDADMRHPHQHDLFLLDNSKGLSALLTGSAGIDVVHRIHPHMRLFVLPAGEVPPNPQELLARSVFDAVLHRCIERFDLIIIDTPARSISADADILAVQAASALFLVRRNHSRSSAIRTMAADLRAMGVNVVGSVISEH